MIMLLFNCRMLSKQLFLLHLKEKASSLGEVYRPPDWFRIGPNLNPISESRVSSGV